MKKITIDFNQIEGPVYSGRSRGEKLRELYDLDNVDKQENIVEVIIPDSTYAMTNGFFLGFFGSSIINFGKLKFYQHYKFTSSKVLKDAIESYVNIIESKRIISEVHHSKP